MPNIYSSSSNSLSISNSHYALHHAWRHGNANILRLFAGILFSITLELATIRQLNAYEYGKFLVVVLDVPLCIGVAWGCILYSVMEFSDASSLPYWMRPILDGLLALNIDLALMEFLVRFGFWDWGQGFKLSILRCTIRKFLGLVLGHLFLLARISRSFARRSDSVRAWIARPAWLYDLDSQSIRDKRLYRFRRVACISKLGHL